ncbi:hypothetical protein PsorP6_011701 [Peronosclerospora sorghi]|uniref:Uncharacterized protein n=1 Tax=Peronosclerospora sorghi TaxID=230839 RepID=A0ACC0WKP4_9STRA|nr:hypothetical protein PsorP6_011701 [Peronosclerospora sorghi]
MSIADGFESTLNHNDSIISDEHDSDDDDTFGEKEFLSNKPSILSKMVTTAEGAKLIALRDSLRKRFKRESPKTLVLATLWFK